MNQAFRQYVFGRSFNINLSDKHIDLLSRLCSGDDVATFGLDSSRHGLMRRGLVEHYYDGHHSRIRPTKAGLLVYDLLVEAGEYAAMEDKRRKALEMEIEIQQAEWDKHYGDLEIKLKDVHRKDLRRGMS